MLSLIGCELSFLILGSVLICVRRSRRSVSKCHVHLDDVPLNGQAASFFKFFVDPIIKFLCCFMIAVLIMMVKHVNSSEASVAKN